MRNFCARVYLLLISLSIVTCLTFNVDPSKEECLYDDINMGVRVSGSFQVLFDVTLETKVSMTYKVLRVLQVSTGGFLDIGVKVKQLPALYEST